MSSSTTTTTRASLTQTQIVESRRPSAVLRLRATVGSKDGAVEKNLHDDAAATKSEGIVAAPTWSSSIVFYPPSDKYWRIGGNWYDLSEFDHPGGRHILELARDRFEDATFAFEAHHHNYKRAYAILNRYRVSDKVLRKNSHHIKVRPSRTDTSKDVHHDSHTDNGQHPRLTPDDAFYSVVRQRVTAYLKEIGCPEGGPTTGCLLFFAAAVLLWVALWTITFQTGSYVAAMLTGIVATWLVAFGHNWVHQPHFFKRGFAAALDLIGFSSDQWYRDHVLHHHMYTNTPWDNYLNGAGEFVPCDPRQARDWYQQHWYPYLFHLILSVGVHAQYLKHCVWMWQGWEDCKCWQKLLWPLQHALFIYQWGFGHGMALMFVMSAVTGNFFYTIALMNHNAESAIDLERRNASKCWGEAQVISSADFCTDLGFVPSMLFCLVLNYHTVHHLFPRVDISHHPAISKIVVETCHDFDIPYQAGDPLTIYKEMRYHFAHQTSSVKEVLVYAGGV